MVLHLDGQGTFSKPLRILISGYYGFSNLGDEAILTSIQKALTAEYPQIDLTVLSANPELTQEVHGLKALSRTDFKTLWRIMGDYDLLLSGGGSLLQDVTSSRSLQYYLFIMALARLKKLPYMIYAQGIGPINSRFNRMLTGWVLKKAKAITVRDQQSVAELISLGLPKGLVELSADPVLLFEGAAEAAVDKILESLHLDPAAGPIIGVSVRPWGKDEKWLQEIAAALDNLSRERQAQILFIPMQQKEDEAMGLKIRSRMKEKNKVYCLPHGYSVEEIIAVMKKTQLVLGVRLHALVFAAIAGVKAIAIRYDPKVDHFAERVGQKLAGGIELLQGETLTQLIMETLDEEPNLKEQLAVLEQLRKAARLSAQRAVQAAAGIR